MGLAIGCAGGTRSTAGASGSTTTTTPTTTTSDDATRAIVEADIIQIQSGVLYALSKSGTVSLIDVSVPDRLVLIGQTTVPGEPFEMYLVGSTLIVMSNGGVDTGGAVTTTYATPDSGGGALVLAVDVSAPTLPRQLAVHPVPGEIADSRLVGDVLYLATYENASCYGCGPTPRTMVTTFNVATPTAMTEVEQVSFQSNAPDGYNLPWGQNWKRSIFVTDERLYIAGHADIDPNAFGTVNEGIVDVLDITDPTGRLVTGARLSVAGAVLSRWQMDEENGVFRVISQQGAGRTGNGLAPPAIDTFAVASAQSFTPLGHTTMQLPSQEGLRTVRFDATRAYAITYNQTDPMFVIDLSDPANPRQRGALYMPGFMYYLEPHGDRVIGLGIDRSDPKGSLNVSLFDVTNPDAPMMLSRAAFATPGITEDYAILNSEISEDQDRIQKAFHVFSDGLVVVPFAALHPSSYDTGSECADDGGGVQLVSWVSDTLVKQTLLPLPGHPRRAFENGGDLITVSDSNVRAFSLANLDVAHQTADLVIGACVPTDGTTNVGVPIEGEEQQQAPVIVCSLTDGRGPGSPALAAVWLALTIGWLRPGRRRHPAQPRS
ncbi:MAG TPA: beta-propeller domain-containing protein [Polyangia bacterium]